jgi:Tfp pilus assembly protein FimT
MIMGYVYLLLQIDNDGNEHYKIGVTKRSIDDRISELQTGNPNKITLHRKYETPNYLKVENWLHRKYQTKTEAKNEWRALTNEQVLYFLDDCKAADDNIKFLLENNHFYK